MPGVLFGDQGIVGECFLTRIAPVFLTNLQVQPLGGGFGEAVGEGLQHDRRIVVMRRLEFGDAGVDAMAGGDGEGADIISLADIIGQGDVEAAFRLLVLLAQTDPAGEFPAAALVAENDDVLVFATRRPQPEHGPGIQPVFTDDFRQHGLRIGEQLAGGFADGFVFQDGRIAAGQVPALEKWGPVDEQGNVFQFEGHCLEAKLPGDDRRKRFVPRETVGARFFQRDQRGTLAAGVFGTHGFVFGNDLGHVGITVVGGQQLGGDADGARGVRHVNHGPFGVGGDLDRGVGAAGGGAADQQRLLHLQALHFAGDVGHFLERRA